MAFSWPVVAILIVTYDRPKEIRSTINALKTHIRYKGKLEWHIADDGSPEGYIHDLQKDYPELDFKVSTTPRAGWGGNVNNGLRFCRNLDYVFMIEDDYVAKRPINLTHGVMLLHKVKELGLVRYDGIYAHNLNLELRELKPTPVGPIGYLRIRRDSPDLYMYSHRPHLKHKRFHRFYGNYPVGQPLGLTEEMFAHRVKDKKAGPDLACLWNGIALAFDHIGVSRQHTKLDPNERGK